MAPSRRTRVDAQRNRAGLVAAAAAVFADRGASAPLELVASRADVSIATLYRHFGTREALVEAAIQAHLRAATVRARALLGAPSPLAAISEWLGDVLEELVRYRGLPEPLRSLLEQEAPALGSACGELMTAGGALLERAQRCGAMRADVGLRDLVDLVSGIAWAADQAGKPARGGRLLAIVIEGLRAPGEGHPSRPGC